MTIPLRCRLGLHDFEDFPDPNPESGGLEKQGYRACTRCAKEKDANVYLSRSQPRLRQPGAHPRETEGHPLWRRPPRSR